MKEIVRRTLIAAGQRSALVSRVAALIANNDPRHPDTYPYLRDKFVANGASHQVDRNIRLEIVRRFEQIDRCVPIGTTPTDGLLLAEMLMNVDTPGVVVECGCYAGGSSAKLSIVVKLLGREMVIFDSFEGLPLVEQSYLRDQHCRRSEQWVTDWTAGRYASRLVEVRENLDRFGETSPCRFIKGWFNETLTDQNLPAQVAFAFVDVDLANSARECFVALWPRLAVRGVFATHDTAYLKVLQEFYNRDLWQNLFKEMPPILFGAGYGICNDSPHLGYMVKGERLPIEYLKGLTLDK
jgi:O-methyltransferase